MAYPPCGEIGPSPPDLYAAHQALRHHRHGRAERYDRARRARLLALLADGIPRRKAAIVEALANRHAGDDVELALIRLAVTGQVIETGGKYALTRESAQGMG